MTKQDPRELSLPRAWAWAHLPPRSPPGSPATRPVKIGKGTTIISGQRGHWADRLFQNLGTSGVAGPVSAAGMCLLHPAFFSNNPPLLCGTEKPLFLSGQWSHPSGHQCPGPAPPAPLSFWGSNKTLEVCTLVRPNPEKLGEQLRVWGNGTQEGRPGQWSATSGALPLQAQQVARAPCLSMHAEVGASLPLQGFGDSCLWDAPSPSS